MDKEVVAMKPREYFTFDLVVENMISRLDEHNQLLLYRAVVQYAIYGENPKLEGITAVAWDSIYPILRKSRVKYEANQKRINHRGGAPLGNQNAAKTAQKQQQNNNKTTTKQQQNNNTDTYLYVGNKSISNDISLFPPPSSSALARREEEEEEQQNKISFFEIEQFIRDNDLDVDAREFFEHHERMGWMLSGTPMRDWRSIVKVWHKRAQEQQRSRRDRKAELIDAHNHPNSMWK